MFASSFSGMSKFDGMESNFLHVNVRSGLPGPRKDAYYQLAEKLGGEAQMWIQNRDLRMRQML